MKTKPTGSGLHHSDTGTAVQLKSERFKTVVKLHKAYKMSKMQANVDILWYRQNNDQS